MPKGIYHRDIDHCLAIKVGRGKSAKPHSFVTKDKIAKSVKKVWLLKKKVGINVNKRIGNA